MHGENRHFQEDIVSMKGGKKKWIILLAAVLLIAALAWLLTKKGDAAEGRYVMTPIDRGDLEAVVSSTLSLIHI